MKGGGKPVHWSDRLLKFLASLKLAVLVILALAAIAAVGTFYESRYDAQVAQKLVYRSPYMYVVMCALVINLVAVMVDRWPWRRHHTPFVLAHIGIITLLAGALVTQKLGLDGSIAFGIGESNRYVSVDETEFSVYGSADGEALVPLFSQKVDFFLQPPTARPLATLVAGKPLAVLDYVHYAIRESQIQPSEKESDGPAIRIQLKNDRVNLSQWLIRAPGQPRAEISLGPARVVLTEGSFSYDHGNVLVLYPGALKWRYDIYTASKGGLTSRGRLSEGDRIPTGWMGLELTALRILPRAREIVTYSSRPKPNQVTRPAIKIRYGNEEHWLGLNSVLKLFSEQGMIWVNFANRRADLGFPITLTKFKVGRYQGTMRAASYESDVSVPGLGDRHISMNEPLKYGGYTFYQASFEQDESGQPTTSILSVNHDPGRFIKYLGSFLMVLGIILLFYFKPRFRPTRSGGT